MQLSALQQNRGTLCFDSPPPPCDPSARKRFGFKTTHSMSDLQPPAETPQAEIYPRGEHQISRSNIDPDAVKILYRLNRAGFRAYLVGGGVRDLLLGKKPKDFDIATDALPRDIKSLFRNSRVIGRRYKLVHIFFAGGKNIEVSTFRDIGVPTEPGDVLDSAAPIVTRENTYGTEATDAVRRDLTINGLFYDISNFSVIDYVGGVRDLKQKVIRVIGDPDIRFIEDPVRMLRVARHAARNDFTIDERTHQSVVKNFHLIARASPVRVFDELKKDFAYGHSLSTFRILAELRLLEPLIPELMQKDGVLLSDVSEFSHCLARLDNHVRDGMQPSSAAVLALFLLFIQGLTSQRRNIYSWFRDQDEIHDASKNCFKYLAVPKKERERIAAALSLWHELGAPPFGRDALSYVKRSPGRQDLALLVRLLSEDEDSEALVRAVEQSPEEKQRRRHGSARPQRTRSGHLMPHRHQRGGERERN
ncbi:MAG: polynucleotide adenylyltransferase PcnB [Proteobacteria bacterium]|nr:polynucleotide adenylyltransferase PcnB [Pseudomonadota bacterium]